MNCFCTFFCKYSFFNFVHTLKGGGFMPQRQTSLINVFFIFIEKQRNLGIKNMGSWRGGGGVNSYYMLE